MKYGWIIDKDVIDNGHSNNLTGPNGISATIFNMLKNGEGEPFRMLDDDRILYYEGRLIGDDNTDGFEPLDDYGTPGAGCTIIQYKNEKSGHWEDL